MKNHLWIIVGVFALALIAGYACSDSSSSVTNSTLGIPDTEITCGGSACIR